MIEMNTYRQRVALAAVGGVIIGGVIVAIVTKAIPKMMSQMMAGMMQNMMARAGKDGCAPTDI
jgi:hypothetical protein